MRAKITWLFYSLFFSKEFRVDPQLPLFTLRLVGLAINILNPSEMLQIFEVVSWDDFVIGYAIMPQGELNAAE